MLGFINSSIIKCFEYNNKALLIDIEFENSNFAEDAISK